MMNQPTSTSERATLGTLVRRTIAAIVLVTFSMLVTAQTAAAVRNSEDVEYGDTRSDEMAPIERFEEMLDRLRAGLADYQHSNKGSKALDRLRDAVPRLADLDRTDRQVRQVLANQREELSGQAMSADSVAHIETVSTAYRDRFAGLRARLERFWRSERPETMVSELADYLDDVMPQRKPDDFDQMPSRRTKAAPDNVPKETKAAFHDPSSDREPAAVVREESEPEALGLARELVQGPQTSASRALASLPGADDPKYLASAAEAEITDTIRTKAEELGNNPVSIYHWVRNNVIWQPSWGGQQTAEMTVDVKRGNAMDTATLLIALLRAAGIPARYVHGTIDVPADRFRNWVGNFETVEAAAKYASSGGIPLRTVMRGGRVHAVRMEHVWVEAAVDFYPARGRGDNSTPDRWLPLDAAYKQYRHVEGIDADELMTRSGDVLADEFMDGAELDGDGYAIRAPNLEAVEQEFTRMTRVLKRKAFKNGSRDSIPLIGGSVAVKKVAPVLPTGFSHDIVVPGRKFWKLPGRLQVSVTLGLSQRAGRSPSGSSAVFPLYAINQDSLHIRFTPATQLDKRAIESRLPSKGESNNSRGATLPATINVVAEIASGSEVIVNGPVFGLGQKAFFRYRVVAPNRPGLFYVDKVNAGSYLAVGVVGSNLSPRVLSDLEVSLRGSSNSLKRNSESGGREISRMSAFGETFKAGVLSYYAYLSVIGRAAARASHASFGLAPSVGTFGYEPTARKLFGIPVAIEPNGVYMNVRYSAQLGDFGGAQEKIREVNLLVGMIASSLEHVLPERMFNKANEEMGVEAEPVSAMAAMQEALESGQHVVYIMPDNRSEIMRRLSLSRATENEIRAALDAGKHVITHAQPINVRGWEGAGYIIVDPETGDGAYKIGGGKNGGYLFLALGAAGLFVSLMILVSMLEAAALAIYMPAFAAFVLASALLVAAGVAAMNGEEDICLKLLGAAGYLYGAAFLLLPTMKSLGWIAELAGGYLVSQVALPWAIDENLCKNP